MTGRRRAVERHQAAVDAHRLQTQRAVADAEIRYRLHELVGMTVADAKAIVEAAGGEFVTDDGPIRAKWDLRRVIASVAEERVIAVRVG